MSSNPTPYDIIAYRGLPYSDTHPSRLATMAKFYGMDPVPPSRCRVLELGCGIGANITPMGVRYPDSEFIGIDLSARSIEYGAQLIDSLGIKNVKLRHADITSVTAEYGKFDYIIAHGVYSWVPPQVRERMLAIFHDNLAPQGVAYVSYNAHPGSHARDMVRDMMNFHVHDIADPEERVKQARAVLKALAEASAPDAVHGVVLRDQLARVDRLSDDVLYHDDLDLGAEPFLLHRVVADAEAHGLQYLCDASMWRRSLGRLPETMQAMLGEFAGRAYMARDQYHDFIEGHGFRRTLLCHAGIKLDRDVVFDSIKRFYFASSARPAGDEIDPTKIDTVDFKNEAGATLATDHPLTKLVLLHLAAHWPGAVHYNDLIDAARARLMASPETQSLCTEEHIEATTNALFQTVCSGHLEFYAFPPYSMADVSERPKVSPLVRKQAELGTLVTSLRHDAVLLEDETLRRFVLLLDGTRDVDQLLVELRPIVEEFKPDQKDKLSREMVERHLTLMGRLALLIG